MRMVMLGVAVVVIGCGGGPFGGSSSSSSSSSSTSSSSSGGGPVCTTPTAPLCSDQLIADLNLKTLLNTGLITNTDAAGVWTTDIDATAGGAFSTNPPSFVYAKFTDTGLVKVDIHDQQALDSMEWDIAFRRYVIRVNSGNSGPSCVEVMRMPDAATLDTVTAPSATLMWRKDDIETDSCTLIPDGSGLMTSPATALASYYSYPTCLKMTGHVFLVRQASGRTVKLVVEKYYNDAAQAECQTDETITTMPTGSGNFRIKWAFLG